LIQLAAPAEALEYAEKMKRQCPICKKPTDSEIDADFPFCGERCRLRDLGNWSSEKYAVSSPALDRSMFGDLERDIAEESDK